MSAQVYNDPYGDQANASRPEFQHVPSTEKIVEEGGAAEGNLGTERLRKGRAGLDPSSQWSSGPPPRSTGILRMWRKDERGKQWSRGGGWRTFFRLCCCCTTVGIILVISVLLTMVLYVRPPNLKLQSINLGAGGVTLATSGFVVPLSLGISVSNPNWFNIDFPQITANVRYPGSPSQFGGGTLNNVNFVGYTESTFQFPLILNYTTALDPNRVILNDLISKCGVGTGTQQDITINYDLHLKLRIAGVVISPTVSSDASFECPISASDIQKITGGSSS